jgi:accessory gene regulator B
MEKLAKKLANNISISLGYDIEKEHVIAYGLTAIIQIIVTVLLILVIGLIVGTPVEALIICFSISILRKYSGGAHAGSIEMCTLISVIYCVGFSLISKYLLASILSTYSMLFIIVLVFALSFLAIYKLAPVDSPNKPIKTEKKKKRMRKDSYIVLTVYLAISITFLLLNLKFHSLISFGISLIFGVMWQILTLTKFISYSFDKIDFAVNKVFRIRKEVDRH